MESVRVSLAAAPIATGAVVLRRSVTTGNQPMATADLRFRRTERISVEVPAKSEDAGTAQLLNPHRASHVDPRRRRNPQRRRWLALAHGAARARAARTWRLRHRADCRHRDHAHGVPRAAVNAVGSWRLVRTLLIIVALLAWPDWAIAQDKWFAADKAQHFAAGAALAGAGYAASVPLTKRRGWRVTIGTSVGLAAAGGKELRHREKGRGSWRDFAWTAGGSVTGRARRVDHR